MDVFPEVDLVCYSDAFFRARSFVSGYEDAEILQVPCPFPHFHFQLLFPDLGFLR
jgi:hypothetical protein